MESEGNVDGSDIFWPGYVDAVTNLVLNLLFMLTIMIVAVFMFALELSRHKNDIPVKVVETQEVEKQQAISSKDMTLDVVKAKDSEIQTLQKELANLKKQVLAQNDLRGSQKVVIAKTPISKSEKEIEKSSSAGGGVVVKFILDAVTLTSTEAETLRSSLASISAGGSARIEVIVPAGFSEAKRLGFYRAMAVRNQLIAMNVPADKIEVSVREGKSGADNSRVLVSPR